MEFHPAANLFPLDDETIDDLAEDIKAHGLQCPVETCGGKIIDGRRRWLACKMAEVEPDIVAIATEDPVAYVLSLNLHRRHLTPSQKAMVGGRAREMYDKAAKERMKKGGRKGGQSKGMENFPDPSTEQTARDAAGKAVGVSGKTVDFASKVIKSGDETLQKAVEKGDVSVAVASKVAELPKPAQRAAVKAGKSAMREVAKQVAAQKATKGLPDGPTPHQLADESPERRWHATLHKLYVFMNSTRDIGGIRKLTDKWSKDGRAKYATELRRIIGELETWAKLMEA